MVLLLFSCSKSEDDPKNEIGVYLNTSLDYMNAPKLPYSGGRIDVSIKSNCSWSIDKDRISMYLSQHGLADADASDYISLSSYNGYGDKELYIYVGQVDFQYDVNYLIYIEYGENMEYSKAISIWQSCNPEGQGGGSDETTISAPEISASVNGSYITVSWSAVTGATEYMVYRSGDYSTGYSLLKTVTNTYITDSSPLKGYNYYKVKASNGEISSEYSNVASVYSSGESEKPGKPVNVRAVQNGNAIDVSWSASQGASYYRVYYVRPAPYDMETFENAYSTSMSFSWNTMVNGRYTFWVVAVNDDYDSSDPSEKVYCNFQSGSGGGGTSTTKLDTPTNLKAYSDIYYVQISFDEVTLANEYELYRSKYSGGPYTKIQASGGSTAGGRYVLTDSNPVSGTSYYKVKAIPLSYLGIEESDMSNYVSVTR